MHATIAHYQRTQTRRLALTLALALAILGALVLDMATGPSGLTWDTLIRTLLHPGQAGTAARVIVWDFRLPYALTAALVVICQ